MPVLCRVVADQLREVCLALWYQVELPPAPELRALPGRVNFKDCSHAVIKVSRRITSLQPPRVVEVPNEARQFCFGPGCCSLAMPLCPGTGSQRANAEHKALMTLV